MSVQVPTDQSVAGILAAYKSGNLFRDQAIGWLRSLDRTRDEAEALVDLVDLLSSAAVITA